MNYNPYRNIENIEIKKATPIKNDIFINKETLKFVCKYLNYKIIKNFIIHKTSS
jgi:hypothetical protein